MFYLGIPNLFILPELLRLAEFKHNQHPDTFDELVLDEPATFGEVVLID